MKWLLSGVEKAVHVSELPHYLVQSDIIIGGTQGEVNLLSEKK